MCSRKALQQMQRLPRRWSVALTELISLAGDKEQKQVIIVTCAQGQERKVNKELRLKQWGFEARPPFDGVYSVPGMALALDTERSWLPPAAALGLVGPFSFPPCFLHSGCSL